MCVFFFFSFLFVCFPFFFFLKKKRGLTIFLRVAYLNPHMSGSWWMCERIRPHSAQCAPNPGNETKRAEKEKINKKRGFYIYRNMRRGGATHVADSRVRVCVCVCVSEEEEGVRIFCFLSD